MTSNSHDRVLIADDDASIRRMLTVSLRKQGYQTVEACDGLETLRAMRAGEADLVLLDLTMPKLTGWQVLAVRAADAELRKIPVIVISAERGDEVAKIPDDGISAFLPKPFSLEALQSLVRRGLLAHA